MPGCSRRKPSPLDGRSAQETQSVISLDAPPGWVFLPLLSVTTSTKLALMCETASTCWSERRQSQISSQCRPGQCSTVRRDYNWKPDRNVNGEQCEAFYGHGIVVVSTVALSSFVAFARSPRSPPTEPTSAREGGYMSPGQFVRTVSCARTISVADFDLRPGPSFLPFSLSNFNRMPFGLWCLTVATEKEFVGSSLHTHLESTGGTKLRWTSRKEE